MKPEKLCRIWGIENWELNSDGTIDINGDLNLSGRRLNEFPIKIRIIRGSLNVSHNYFKNLKGFPTCITGNLNVSFNKLKTLEGKPKYIDGYISLEGNDRLKSTLNDYIVEPSINFEPIKSAEIMETPLTTPFTEELPKPVRKKRTPAKRKPAVKKTTPKKKLDE